MTRVTWAGVVAAVALAAGANVGAGHWPGFRGPTGQGVSDATGLPVTWSADRVAWKTAVRYAGWSSPIVHGDRVFVTGTTEDGATCAVAAYDRLTGRVVWEREVLTQEVRRKEKMNSYATPTPVTDGERVYAFFGGGGAAAVSATDGRLLWTNTDVAFYSQHGLGASPVLFEQFVIMPFDGSSPGEDKSLGWQKPWEDAVIVALDRATGKRAWTARRGPSRIAHATPLLVDVNGRTELVSGAGDVVQGFDPRTGERLWTVRSRGEGVVPSIVSAAGLVISVSGFEDPTIRAVRPGGRGDVTGTHLAWEQKRTVPMIPSFVPWNGLLYGVKENGLAIALDASTGEVVWQERLPGTYSASPIAAGGRVYFLSEEGVTTVVAAGRAFRQLASNALDGRFQASPAAAPGQLILRSWTHLIAVGG